jgi:uncharacterized protein (TIGR02001 family)
MELKHMKKTLLALSALALFAGAAQAGDGLTANVALTTKYKFRGQDQADATKDSVMAVQGGFDYTMGGFYVGNWNSSVGFAHGTEVDLYGGYKGEIAKDLGYDVGLLQYYYPGSNASSLNTTEIYGALSYSFFTVKYSHTVSSKYFGLREGDGTGYLDLSANYELMKNVTLNAHLGYTRLSGGAKTAYAQDTEGGSITNYSDYKLGATYDFGSGVSLAGAFVGATKKSVYGDINKGRLVLTLTKTM